MRDDACQWCEAVTGGRRLAGQQQRTAAVIHPRGVACRDGAIGAHHALEPGQLVKRRVRARMLVDGHLTGLALARGDGHRNQLVGKPPGGLGRRPALLTAERERVLVGARNVELGRDVLGRLGHRVSTELLAERRIHEPPADGRVFDLHGPREGGVGLAHHVGRTRHTFHAAGQHQLRVTGADGPRREADRIEARSAQAVDGGPGHRDRQASQQRRRAGDIAIVFPGLVGTAHVDFVDRGPVDMRMAGHERPQGKRRQVVGAHRRQRAAIAANRCADSVTDEGLRHGLCSSGRGVWVVMRLSVR